MDVSKLTNLSELKLAHQLGQPQKNTGTSEFAKALQTEAEKRTVRFSRHAEQRMASRGVEMTPGLLKQLNDAVEKARAKGSRDIAVIAPTEAFIVNVPNNTVITTMTGTEMKENIFTNIDSAVLI
ncbi:MAG: flagellar biosynthesis protein [Lachnospiraceae bacterium]|nr:flagellar biosynthesis protein [Lachnospiraceae bacterium]